MSRPVCLLTGYSTAVTTSLKLSCGERFGHLTAVEQARFDNHQQLWWFKCSCGTVTVCKVHEVKSGNTRSCGWLRLRGTKSRSFRCAIAAGRGFCVFFGVSMTLGTFLAFLVIGCCTSNRKGAHIFALSAVRIALL